MNLSSRQALTHVDLKNYSLGISTLLLSFEWASNGTEVHEHHNAKNEWSWAVSSTVQKL